MNKRKSLAEQANRFMDEDFLQAPQPSTDFDPFAPNYGDVHKPAKLPVPDEKKPMETDVEKDVDQPESPDKDNEDGDKGNKSLVKKMYSEMSMLIKDIIVKSKNIDDKFDKIVTNVDNESDETITALDGISSQLYEDIERFNGVIKSVLEMINSVDEPGKEEEPEVKATPDQEKEEETEDSEASPTEGE